MLDGQELSWVWAIRFIAFALGIIVGVGFALYFLKDHGHAKKLQEEVDTLQKQLDDYKNQVTQHFKQTSSLVQKMTESYRDVYTHLAASSQQLCDEPMDGLLPDLNNQDPKLESAVGIKEKTIDTKRAEQIPTGRVRDIDEDYSG